MKTDFISFIFIGSHYFPATIFVYYTLFGRSGAEDEGADGERMMTLNAKTQ